MKKNMKKPNPLATPAQDKAEDIFLALGLDTPFEEVKQALELAGFQPTDDEVEMGWEDAKFEIEKAAEAAEAERMLEELDPYEPPYYRAL
jgi:hypothetical protein